MDSTVYEFRTPREYINAVYLRGVQMLQNLRDDIGDDAFFELLRAYGEAGAGRVADPTLFWRHLTDEQGPITQDTRSEFLRNPDVQAPLANNGAGPVVATEEDSGKDSP